MRDASNVRRLFLLAVGLACACTGSPRGFAQISSNAPTVTLNASLGELLTLSASVSAVNFTLVAGGVAAGSAQVPITTTWVLLPTRSTVKLYGFFSSATSALTDGASDNIPSADVLGQVTTGTPTSFTAFTTTAPFGGAAAGLQLFSQAISLSNIASSRTDDLGLEIDLSTTPQLPAGSYTGTLTLQAQAQ